MQISLDALLKKEIEWIPYCEQELLQKGLVHIFILDIRPHFEKLFANDVLSPEELLKADLFLQQQDRKNYITRKYFLRLLLSRFLDIPPAALNFHLKAKKKPGISGIEFNVSHSKDYIVIAFSPTAIGIDIEHIDPNFQYNEVVELCFNAQENRFIAESSPRILGFYTLWTRKEAILKASGEGLVDELDQVPSLTAQVLRQNQLFNLETFLTTTGQLISIASSENSGNMKFWRVC